MSKLKAFFLLFSMVFLLSNLTDGIAQTEHFIGRYTIADSATAGASRFLIFRSNVSIQGDTLKLDNGVTNTRVIGTPEFTNGLSTTSLGVTGELDFTGGTIFGGLTGIVNSSKYQLLDADINTAGTLSNVVYKNANNVLTGDSIVIGNNAITERLSIKNEPVITVDKDNFLISVSATTSYIRLTSDEGTDRTQRTFFPDAGTRPGHIIILEWTSNANFGEMLSGSNNVLLHLGAEWRLDSGGNANFTMMLLWNGTNWLELNRSEN